MSDFFKFIKFNLPDIPDAFLNMFGEIGLQSFLAFEGIEDDDTQILFHEIENSITKMSDERIRNLGINTHEQPTHLFKLLYGEKCTILGVIKRIKKMNMTDRSIDIGIDTDSFLKTVKSLIENDSTKKDMVLWAATDKEEHRLLKELIRSSIRCQRSTKGNRFSSELMMISGYIYIKIGKSAYTFLTDNLMLPSVSNIKSKLHEIHPKIKIGEIDARGLKNFLQERKLPLCVGFAEDATRIKSELKYDSDTNQLIGIVIPCDKNTGLPNNELLVGVTPEDILKLAKGRPRALFVQVIMAQPMVKGII
jgi:hypothetical protein